jgi:hypothetical protein
MKKLLLTADFLGFSPSLLIQGRKIYPSFLTGVLSICTILLGLMCVGYFGSELLVRGNPTMIISAERTNDFGPYPLSNKGFQIMLGLEHKNFTYYSDPTIFRVEAEANVIRYEGDQQKFEARRANVDLCEKFYTQDDIIEKNIIMPLDKFYCVEPNTVNISGYWGSPTPYSYIRIYFKKCVNSTTTNIVCKPQEIIEETIQGGYISLQFTSYSIDPKNYTTPLQRDFYDDFNLLNSAASLAYNIDLSPIYFKSDNGLLFEEFQQTEGKNNYIRIFNKIGKSDDIVSFFIQGSNDATVYSRTYTKIQTVLTQIGGFTKAISLLASLMSYMLSKNYFFSEILFNNYYNVNFKQFESSNNESKFPFESSLFPNKNQDSVGETKSVNMMSNNNLNNRKSVRLPEKSMLSPREQNVSKNNSFNLDNKKVRKINVVSKRKNNMKKSEHNFTILSSLTDSLMNQLMFCKGPHSQTDNYKRFNNVEGLYEKLLSVDVIMRKFYDLEVLTCLSKKGINFDESYKIGVFKLFGSLKTDYAKDRVNIFNVEKDDFNE